jgi:predicted amidophosphoribosyltransferase
MTVVLILCALYLFENRACARCGRPLSSFFSPCPQCGKKVGERPKEVRV